MQTKRRRTQGSPWPPPGKRGATSPHGPATGLSGCPGRCLVLGAHPLLAPPPGLGRNLPSSHSTLPSGFSPTCPCGKPALARSENDRRTGLLSDADNQQTTEKPCWDPRHQQDQKAGGLTRTRKVKHSPPPTPA